MPGSAAAAARRTARLFEVDFRDSDTGIVQVAAIWAPERRFIDVRPGSPRSETDHFLLNLSRARSDAIITTGAILRAEPGVTHAIDSADLRAFRNERLGKARNPISLVLTSGRGLNGSHPMFQSGESFAFTSACSLPGITVVHDPSPSLARAIRHLREKRGCRLISLEIGPETTQEAFRESGLLTELMLSSFLEPELDPAFRGGAFPSEESLDSIFPVQTRRFESREESGMWQFCLYRRR